MSFVLTYRLNKRGSIVGKQPILVFEYDQAAGWKIRNIDNGPALNISIWLRGKESKWSHEVRVPALSKDREFTLNWVGKLNAWMLGAVYGDFEGREYTSVSQHDANTIRSGNKLNDFNEPRKDYLPGFAATRHWNTTDLSDERTLT